MLSGNPDTFAIWCDPVPSWSTDHFKNGCFAYFLGGEILWTLNSTLGVDLNLLSGLHCVTNSVEDDRLFSLPLVDAYKELCAKAFPSMDSNAGDSDYTHLVSVGSLLDKGYNVFLIESGDQAKLVYGFNDEISSIREIALSRGEFQTVISDITKTR